MSFKMINENATLVSLLLSYIYVAMVVVTGTTRAGLGQEE